MPIITTALERIDKSFKEARHLLHIAKARAVKRASVSVVKVQSQALGAEVNLRAGAIKKAIKVRENTNDVHPSVTHAVEMEGMPLREFIGTRVTRKGVSFKALKKGSRSVFRAAFVVPKYGAHFFGRAGTQNDKEYGRPHVKRAPIVKLFGPSILSRYLKPAVQKKGSDTWWNRIPIELAREEAFALKKAGVID